MVVSNAFDNMKQHYTARAAASSAENTPGVGIDIVYLIKANEYNVATKMATALTRGQATVTDFFQNLQTADVEFVHDNIGRTCEQTELVIRETIAKLEYDNSKAAGRRAPNSAAEIEELTVPLEVDATVQLTVRMVGHIGKSREEMYASGVASIYDHLRQQIKNFTQTIDATLNAFQASYGAVVNAVVTNAIIKDDWKAVQEAKEKLNGYELCPIDTLKDEIADINAVGLDRINDVANNVHDFYENSLTEVHVLASRLFAAMTILEYDLKHSIKSSVNA